MQMLHRILLANRILICVFYYQSIPIK